MVAANMIAMNVSYKALPNLAHVRQSLFNLGNDTDSS